MRLVNNYVCEADINVESLNIYEIKDTSGEYYYVAPGKFSSNNQFLIGYTLQQTQDGSALFLSKLVHFNLDNLIYLKKFDASAYEIFPNYDEYYKASNNI